MITIKNGYRISIMLTEKCNLNCTHCYMSANTHGKTLSTEQIQHIISNLPDHCLRISITGGEPYMCKDKLYFMLNCIKNRFSQNPPEVRVETNGMFFYQNKESIKKELLNLIGNGVNTLRLSDDEFHQAGGLNREKLKQISEVANENALNIAISTLYQEQAAAFGRAKTLPVSKREKKMCLNKKDSISIPYFYTTLDGEVSTCAWKCAPSLGNCFVNSWEEILTNLNTPMQTAIIKADIIKAAEIFYAENKKEFEKIKSIIERQGHCMGCREMFKGTYE